jgi:hypothetical protein
MKNGYRGFLALGSMLTAFLLATAPAFAQGVDDKIKELERELSQLKAQQIELKKEATEAAAAMPTFSYRPGNGVLIEAADKSWSFRAALESHFRMNLLSGKDQVGRTNGEIEGRRFRPEFYYCLNNCLWELDARIDLDGFGGGTGKNATGDDFGSILQRAALHFHAENLNPFLPTVTVGMDISGASTSTLRQGSSAVGAQAEYDLHTANNGNNTGRAGNGIALDWDDRSLSGIGIPGRINRFQLSMANIAEGDDGLSSFTDRKDFNVFLGVSPFSQVKNKWLRGITFEGAVWFCNVDDRAAQNGCARYRVRDNSRAGRQTLFDTGNNSIGEGLHTAFTPGFGWQIGPYRLRTMGHIQRSDDGDGAIGAATTPGKKKAYSWLIGHDLFLWSPKGFLTGSATTAGSILIGTHFERVDMRCSTINCSGDGDPINDGEFKSNHVILREFDLWYFIAPRMSIGASLLWYDAKKLTAEVQENLGIRNTGVPGRGGDWVDVFLNWRYAF